MGTSDPKRKRRRKDEAVDPEHFEWLRELLSAEPHLEYDEMCGRISESFDVEYTPRQIRFCCHENKITRKKLELQAREQDDVEMASFRTAVRLDFQGGVFREDQFLWGDESHGERAGMSRTHGFADRGLPAFRRLFDTKGHSQGCSAIAFFNCEGIFDARVFDTTVNKITADIFLEVFEFDVLPKMNPFPLTNSVLFLDNATQHHKHRFEALCLAA